MTEQYEKLVALAAATARQAQTGATMPVALGPEELRALGLWTACCPSRNRRAKKQCSESRALLATFPHPPQ